MKNKSQSPFSQIILVIGIIIAAVIIVLQVRSIFVAQAQLAQKEAVEILSSDISSYIDKCMAITSSIYAVYEPKIKEYTLEVKNNIVTIHDKTSGKTASFSKPSPPELVKSYIEDSEKIKIQKIENKIYILGEGCKKSGESCRNSKACCAEAPYCWGEDKFACKKSSAPLGQKAADDDACSTNYLNKLTGKCDTPSKCPQPSICPGAPESFEIFGEQCCPKSKPICSFKHCCPSDNSTYCQKPISGTSRCMAEEDYKTECIPPFKLIIIPVNYDNLKEFKQISEEAANYWIGISPFNECPESVNKIITDDQNCRCQPITTNCIYSCASSWGLIPSDDKQGNHWKIVGIGSEWDLGIGVIGYRDCLTSCCSKDTYQAKVVWVTKSSEKMGRSLSSVFSRYLGYTFGLCGKMAGENDDGPIYCGQPTCSQINYPGDEFSVMKNAAMIRYDADDYSYMRDNGIPYPIKYYCGD